MNRNLHEVGVAAVASAILLFVASCGGPSDREGSNDTASGDDYPVEVGHCIYKNSDGKRRKCDAWWRSNRNNLERTERNARNTVCVAGDTNNGWVSGDAECPSGGLGTCIANGEDPIKVASTWYPEPDVSNSELRQELRQECKEEGNEWQSN